VLGQLKRGACPDCLRYLLEARRQRDFGKLRGDPRLLALVKDVVVKEPDYAALTRKLYEEIGTTDENKLLLATIAHGRVFTFVFADVNAPPTRQYIHTEKAAREFAFPADFYLLLRRGQGRRQPLRPRLARVLFRARVLLPDLRRADQPHRVRRPP